MNGPRAPRSESAPPPRPMAAVAAAEASSRDRCDARFRNSSLGDSKQRRYSNNLACWDTGYRLQKPANVH
eukprot:5796527-Pleurochrysis_carterae.AAC.1